MSIPGPCILQNRLESYRYWSQPLFHQGEKLHQRAIRRREYEPGLVSPINAIEVVRITLKSAFFRHHPTSILSVENPNTEMLVVLLAILFAKIDVSQIDLTQKRALVTSDNFVVLEIGV